MHHVRISPVDWAGSAVEYTTASPQRGKTFLPNESPKYDIKSDGKAPIMLEFLEM